MQGCCLEGCESYKYITKQKIDYFKFPTHNKLLLQKWLNKIRIPNWLPSEVHQICSTHFHVDDIDFSQKQPKLKDNAIPMIFPLKHFQNIYIDKISNDTAQVIPTKIISNKSEGTQQIVMSNPNSILHTPPKASSMVLLCTPTQESNNISNLQISSLPTSNISMKKIPIKNDLINSNSKSPELSSLNPYVLIISDNKKAKMPFKNESLKKTHAILKIQIDKKINNVSSNDSITDYLVKKKKCNQINDTDNTSCFQKNYMEEVEVDDSSSSKVVVFKFDSSTGEITVLKKEKLKQNNEITEQKFNDEKPKSINTINNLEKNQEKLINCKENFQTFNNASAVVSTTNSIINNLNITIAKVNQLDINIKHTTKDTQDFIEKDDLEIQKNEVNEDQLNICVKTVTESFKIDHDFDLDFCFLKNDTKKKNFMQ